MSEDLIQAPSATDKPSGDHPVSEPDFHAKASELWESLYEGKLLRIGGIEAIATALAEAYEKGLVQATAGRGASAVRSPDAGKSLVGMVQESSRRPVPDWSEVPPVRSRGDVK